MPKAASLSSILSLSITFTATRVNDGESTSGAKLKQLSDFGELLLAELSDLLTGRFNRQRKHLQTATRYPVWRSEFSFLPDRYQMLFISDKIRKHLSGQDDIPFSETDIRSLLKKAGLRSTRQRIALGNLLFQGGHRHITADDLHTAMIRAGVSLSLATVYNALNQFTSAGLLRKISIAGEQAYYDTDPQSHQHFYIEDEQKIINVPAGTIHFKELPAPPEGYAIRNIEVIIQLRRID